MPTELSPGIFLWTRAEAGLPDIKIPQARKSEWFLHYTTGQELGRADVLEWAREIDRFHRNSRGWEYGFGYNFGAANDQNDPNVGHIIEGRGWNGVGAHTKDHNTRGFGVVFFGNDDPGVSDATPGALRAIRLLFELSMKREEQPFDYRKIKGHREVAATGCPGAELLGWKNAGMSAGEWTPAPAAPAPPAPVKPAVVRSGTGTFKRSHPMVQKGARNAQHVQELVGVRQDGIFGRDTLSAVKAVQRNNGLEQDGIVGPLSWAAFHPVLRRGTVHELVKELQREVGVSDDGNFGPRTEDAVRGYQRGSGLAIDGVVGRQTYGKMLA